MHPIIYTFPETIPILGGASIYSYGVMMGLGIISSWYLGMHYSVREGLSYKTVTTAYALGIIFALIGARIAHLITNPQSWKFDQGFFPALFASKCEGLVAYGGYIGGILAVLVYLKIKKVDFWSFMDCAATPMLLGLGITRIGCLLAGCCHGIPTDVPWCLSFPPGSQAASVYPGGMDGYSLCVHPTQIYESLVGFFLVAVGLFAFKKRKFTGQVFLILIACYAVARFLLETIRGDTDRGYVIGSISTSQFIGIVLIFFVIGFYIYRRKKAPAPPEPLSKEEVQERLIEEGVIKVKDANKSAKGKKSQDKTAEPVHQEQKSSKKNKKKKKKK
ncbi:MAG: prolipoprotein diacylglyceryl transferase [Deltaproteobacteria bacterium]|nr:prolipoprotein diacylglyceryl transferase [Deltaproteobacteria bacterium]